MCMSLLMVCRLMQIITDLHMEALNRPENDVPTGLSFFVSSPWSNCIHESIGSFRFWRKCTDGLNGSSKTRILSSQAGQARDDGSDLTSNTIIAPAVFRDDGLAVSEGLVRLLIGKPAGVTPPSIP